jgi:hypothetical protein
MLFPMPLKGERKMRAYLALFLTLTLLTLAPFAAALEIQHELAAADHDGQEHSDTDLCQWLLHHTTSSLLLGLPSVSASVTIGHHEWPNSAPLLSTQLLSSSPSRAPPQS